MGESLKGEEKEHMTGEIAKAVVIFFSYSYKDRMLKKELERQLSPLKRSGLITSWHDRNVSAGKEWASEIDEHLKKADIILLLVSPEFINSDYCYGIEMRRALEKHEAGKARVIPIILRQVDWEEAPFSKLQVLPTDRRPVTSWNNRDEALYDVAQGIRKAIEDLVSTSSVNSPIPGDTEQKEQNKVLKALPIWNIPYERNPFFTGREDFLKKLEDTINESKMAVAISGLGGIGKTQIVIEYAYRYRDDYQAVLWANADSQHSLISGFVRIAEALSLPEKNEQDHRLIVQAVKHWMAEHSDWLLILDNVEDLSMARGLFPSISTGKCHILLTTRLQPRGRLTRIEVNKMPPDEGAHFILRRTRTIEQFDQLAITSLAEYAKAKELSGVLDGLPLALDQAGAYIEETRCGISGYLKLYPKNYTRLLHLRGKSAEESEDDHPESVATTWLLSFKKVEDVNPAARDLLNLCAFLHPDAIPEEIITNGASIPGSALEAIAEDPLKLDEAIRDLLNFSLVSRNSDQTLTIHHLVQTIIKNRMEESQQQQWAACAVRAVNHVFPSVKFATWQQCERLLTQALACSVLVQQWELTSADAAQLLNRAGNYLQERAQYGLAESLLKQSLTIHKQMDGVEHSNVARSLHNLASLYHIEGKYDKAKLFYQQALKMYERTLGPEHPDVVSILNNQAELYCAKCEYTKAERLYKKALAIYEKTLGPEHPNLIPILGNLAECFRVQSRYDDAEPLYLRGLAICEQARGENDPEVAQNLNNLGALYSSQGNFSLAEKYYKKAISIHEQALGLDHPHLSADYNNLALLYLQQGKYTEAENLYLRALEIDELALGQEHPEVVIDLNNLGGLYRNQRDYVQAEKFFQRALDISKQTLGPNHHEVATALNNLGEIEYVKGEYNQAKQLFKEALAIDEQALGPNHPEVAIELDNLGAVYRMQDNYIQAEEYYKRALAIHENVLGQDHSYVAQSLNNLAELYRTQGKYNEAEPLFKRALAIWQQDFMAAQSNIATLLENYAVLLRKTGREREAIELEEQASEILTRLDPEYLLRERTEMIVQMQDDV